MWSRENVGKLNLLLNFAVNLKLLFKNAWKMFIPVSQEWLPLRKERD